MTKQTKICFYCKNGNHHLCAYRVCDCPHTDKQMVDSNMEFHKEK